MQRSATARRALSSCAPAGLVLVLAFALAEARQNAGPADAPTGTQAPPRARVLFLRVEFPNQPSKRPTSDFTNESRSGLIDRLVSYYDEVSLGRFHIEPILSQKVYRLPRPRGAYVSRPALMIQDALDLARREAPDGESALFERDPEIVAVLFAGPGAESDIKRQRPGLPWSNSVTLSGSIPRGMVIAEDPMHGLSPFGVMCHEFGHVLGLPELYAPNKAHEGVGIWGLMGQGTWVGMGDSPPHPSAWCKLKLGWVDPILVDKTQKMTLPSVSRSGRVIKIYARGPDTPTEYFLIENRERRGADRLLPGAGLLVWHIDEGLTSFRRSQDERSHKRVDLLTADSWPSHLDIGHAAGGNRGDAGDPWSARALGPGPDTQPSTGAYGGSRGRFSLRNISPSGEMMTFDVVFEEDAKAASAAPPAPESALEQE